MKIQTSVIKDTIEITNAKGETIKEIPFVVNLTQIAKQLQAKRIELANTDKADIEAVGQKIVEMFNLIFGETTTNELLEFYADDYTAMMIDVAPIITDLVFPTLEKLSGNGIALKKRAKRN